MKILLTGSTGQLGREILKTKPKGVEIIIKKKIELNLLSKKSCIENVKRYKPDWIINCAAYTNVDKAEVQQELAFNINSLAPKYFSEAIKDYGGNLLHVSTDYVFSGTKKTPYLPSDEKSPINKYGYTKAKGEDFILENLSNLNKVHIIRTSWLMSEYRDNFALKILKKLSQNKDLRVINDQIGCPTTAFTLAKACWRAVNNKSEKIKIPQILHYCNSGIASWYDVAVTILEIGKEQKLLKKQIKIIPTSSKSYPLQAQRPHYSVLDTSDTLDKLSLEPIYWKESISDLFNQLKNS